MEHSTAADRASHEGERGCTNGNVGTFNGIADPVFPVRVITRLQPPDESARQAPRRIENSNKSESTEIAAS